MAKKMSTTPQDAPGHPAQHLVRSMSPTTHSAHDPMTLLACQAEAAGRTYYWNQRTNETTALGEPRPGPEGRLTAYRRATVQPGQVPVRTAGLGQLMAMGAGVGLVFALLARLL